MIAPTCPPPPGRDRAVPSPPPPLLSLRSPHSRRAPVAELVGDGLDAAGPRHGDVAALETQVKTHHGHDPAATGRAGGREGERLPTLPRLTIPALRPPAPVPRPRRLRAQAGREGSRRRRFKYDNEAKFPETAATTHRLHVRLPLPPSVAFSNNSYQSAAPGSGDAIGGWAVLMATADAAATPRKGKKAGRGCAGRGREGRGGVEQGRVVGGVSRARARAGGRLAAVKRLLRARGG